jgi:acyl carrier protein
VTSDLLALMAGILDEQGYALAADVVPAEVTFAQLGFDSLALLEFLMLIDERTGVEVTTDVVTSETTLGELAALISQQSA